VVGRNEQENKQVESQARPDDLLLRPVGVMGPVVLLRSEKKAKKEIETAARIAARYSDGDEGKAVKFEAGGKEYSVKPFAEDEVEQWRVKPVQKEKPAPDQAAPEPEPAK
jgi:predicted ribosome quality control (RQC) complex YloA/Tae2 family protein